MEPEGGRLAENVVRFTRTLRAAGMRVGPGRSHDAAVAAAAVGVERREDFYWALHAALVSRADERALFAEAFRLFWRDPGRPLALPAPASHLPPTSPNPASRRTTDALVAERAGSRRAPEPGNEREIGVGWSDQEVLRSRDFEQMTAEELREAERAITALVLPVRDLPVRRLAPDPRGERVDPRATLRAAIRTGGASIPLRWRGPTRRPPAVVALCDVSGSMSRYARVMLRFLHALQRRRGRTHAFTFGTRLTQVTRQLRHRDPDAALAAVGQRVPDWDGGTRIGAALREFNRLWARRLLAQGAIVLLLSDGLDRDEGRGIAEEAERLRRSCRRLVWLNPLLRWSGFEPRAAGVRALVAHVDESRPVHDLDSLARLAEALSAPVSRSRGGRPDPASSLPGARGPTPTAP